MARIAATRPSGIVGASSAEPRPDWDDLRYFLEVARTQRVSAAAQRLGVDHTTVSRRVRALEQSLGTLLFDKSRNAGFALTPEGQQLLVHAEQMETALQSACEQVAGLGQTLSGHVRIGSTEAFGTYFIAPVLSRFQREYPAIDFDVLPVPRFVSLSKREADLAITIERPQRGPYVCSKLCDYRLLLYATPGYLKQYGNVATFSDLRGRRFISYVDELSFSNELRYLEDIVPGCDVVLRSTSVIAQYQAALQGEALAILPCFMAAQDPRLVPLLVDDVVVTRSFWIYCHEELRTLKRITVLWDYLRDAAQRNDALLQGTAGQLQWR
ncbi:LysR family transcriptional regulator [Pandoraea fibrosis]|uniref:LysR family transcriptional regulator n=1 Tax=Pandoraea fibrosis TaxID=1891094 RepID=A0A5E4UMM8_9BURK|nr:LysR family transcriptional regulator [Pandoraea fibrosis]VVE00793.1 LysR family transcriptional regulator [Pandoraea fibrosis]